MREVVTHAPEGIGYWDGTMMAKSSKVVTFCLCASLAALGCGSAQTADAISLNPSIASDELEASSTYWAQYGRTARRTSHNPFETLIGPSNVASLVTAWHCCEGESPAIALSHERLFTGGVTFTNTESAFVIDMTARALDPATGAVRWSQTLSGDDSTFDTDEGPGQNITVGYGLVHLHQFGYSYLFSTATGRAEAGRYLGPDSQSWPVMREQWLVYSGNSDISTSVYTVTAADPQSGRVLWSKPQGLYRWQVEGALALADGTVFTLTDEHRLIALNAATGSTVWTTAAAAGPLGAPSVYLGHVLVVSRPKTLQAYDEKTGALTWQSTLDATVNGGGDEDGALAESAPALADDGAYAVLLATTGIAIAKFDLTTGEKRWERTLVESPFQQFQRLNKAIANGVLYVGGGAGNLYALDAQSGVLLATFALGGAIQNIIVADGRVHATVAGHGVTTLSLPSTG